MQTDSQPEIQGAGCCVVFGVSFGSTSIYVYTLDSQLEALSSTAGNFSFKSHTVNSLCQTLSSFNSGILYICSCQSSQSYCWKTKSHGSTVTRLMGAYNRGSRVLGGSPGWSINSSEGDHSCRELCPVQTGFELPRPCKIAVCQDPLSTPVAGRTRIHLLRVPEITATSNGYI